MHETVLIILAAVVALIVVVVLLGMRYLRADDDDFDIGAHEGSGPLRSHADGSARERVRSGRAEPGRTGRAERELQRIGAGPAGSARLGRSDDRSGRERDWQADRGRDRTGDRDRQARGPGQRSLDERDRGVGRDRDDLSRRTTATSRDGLDGRPVTRPSAKPQARRPDNGELDGSLPPLRPRPVKSQAKGKRDSDGDWPSTEWDELSDVDYWAELASDKPLPEPASQAAPSAHGGRPASRRTEESLARRGGSERGRSERRRPGRGGDDRGGSRRDTDPGSPRPDRLGGDDRGAAMTPAGQTPESVLAGLARPAETAISRGKRDEFTDTGSRRAAYAAADRHGADRSGYERSLPASGRSQHRLDDDPLTSPSFPRIEAEDGRSYRRSRSASSSSSSYPSPGYPAGSAGTYPSPAGERSMPRGYPESGTLGYPSPAGRGNGSYGSGTSATSGGHSIPAAAPAQPQLPAGGYPATSSDSGGHLPPGGSAGDYPPIGSGGYMAPPSQAGGFAADPYSASHSDSYQVPSPAPRGYAPPPSASYPAESGPGSYSPAASSGQYDMPSGGLGYGTGPADQAVAYPGYPPPQGSGPHSVPHPSAISGPHLSPHSGPHTSPHQQPDGQGGYQAAAYQPGYQPGADYAQNVPAGFPGQNAELAAAYPPYPAPVPGTAALGSGYGQDLMPGQVGTGRYPDAAYGPYDPPGYTSANPSGYPAADPYAMDPYSGYRGGGY